MDNGDGISLQATVHPKAPWYKSLWLRIFHRDIREPALELVSIDTAIPGSPQREWYFDGNGVTLVSDTAATSIIRGWSPAAEAQTMNLDEEKK